MLKPYFSSVCTPLFFLIIVLVSTVGCSPVTVVCDYDHSVNFRTYKSFAWISKPNHPFSNSGFDNQIIESNIKNYVSTELKYRGYIFDADNPDVLLDYDLHVERKTQTVSTPIYNNTVTTPAYNNYNNQNLYNNNQGYNYNNAYNYNGNYNYGNTYAYNRTNPMAYNTYTPPYVVGYNTQQIPYEEGTLTLSVVERSGNRLIWRGSSVGTVTDPESYEAELQGDIHKIFKRYPVPYPGKR